MTAQPMCSLVVKAIVAMDEGRVIGTQNKLPWHLPEDLKRFSALTKGHAVLMGRNTFDSLPAKFKPLPGRLNIVISRKLSQPADGSYVVYSSPGEAIKACREGRQKLTSDTLWVIGGEQIYRETLPEWDELFLTRVHSRTSGDAFFPEFEEAFSLVEDEAHGSFSFQRFVRS